MTTTGTTLFNMDFTEIAEEAWERAGREMRSGYDLRTARRSMNLMTIEWQSKGINMWTMEQGIINLTPGLSTYALPTDTIDLLEHVMESRGLSRRDLEPMIGPRGRVADILNKSRPLTLEMIRRLVDQLQLPAEVLVKPYRLRKELLAV